MDIQEIKAAVKEAAEEGVGKELVKLHQRLDDFESRLTAMEAGGSGDVEKAVEEVVGKAMKAAGLGGSSQVDLDGEEWSQRHSHKSSSDRRDAFGRRTRGAG